jgi:murein DD-endopeptidase MepM/ murein hydrolase activator NlpD
VREQSIVNNDRHAIFCKRAKLLDIRDPYAIGIAVIMLAALTTGAAWLGFQAGRAQAEQVTVGPSPAAVLAELDVERRRVEQARVEQRVHLDAVTLRVAELQAHMMRLDALGGRLVEAGQLDPEEFDFSRSPAVGGVDDELPPGSQDLDELASELQRIDGLLADRGTKLARLEQVLMTRVLQAEVTPSGRPVEKGWLSSGFGRRTDPFSGKKSYHRGVDFAGKRGSEVVAVASGVVTRAERTAGYGNLVEILHADGYHTLYGHNQENLVTEGEVVSKGQTIALLGSTGRSSGPHVHFEVLKDGSNVDPLRFVR